MIQRLAEIFGLRRPTPEALKATPSEVNAGEADLEVGPPPPPRPVPAPDGGIMYPTAPEASALPPVAPDSATDDEHEDDDQPNTALASGDIPIRHPFREAVIDAVRTVFDPEIPTNIYELGLIYELDIDAQMNVVVRMTLTAPGCPVAGEMPDWVRDAVAGVEGAGTVEVELVWDPPWDPSRMSEIARLETGFMY